MVCARLRNEFMLVKYMKESPTTYDGTHKWENLVVLFKVELSYNNEDISIRLMLTIPNITQ
jgi:hypothetical protein